MASERVQRQIERLLDEAETAIAQRNWGKVPDLVADALRLDPGNQDAHAFLVAAEREPDNVTISTTALLTTGAKESTSDQL